MNRHLARTLAMQTIYEWDFQAHKSIHEMLASNVNAVDHADDDTVFVEKLINGVVANKEEIDGLITTAAPEWPLDQISVVDKSILRLAIYEILHETDVPAKVAINEAVELAKTFGGDNSSRFVNGVLGTIYRQTERFKQDSANQPATGVAETTEDKE
ncbi:MAG TPA: transcription antitermination factor NusB [Patescibacteria group bacterium]